MKGRHRDHAGWEAGKVDRRAVRKPATVETGVHPRLRSLASLDDTRVFFFVSDSTAAGKFAGR
jgi:hypothetical protein